MDSSSIARLATGLSNQQTAQQLQTSVIKLANQQLAAQGASVIQLLDSVPAPTGSSGNIINTKV